MKRHEIQDMEDALEYYKEQQAQAYERYQETGQRRYANDEFLDGILVNALEIALGALEAVDNARIRRSDQIYSYIENKLDQETYTKAEVERLLKQSAWW